MKALPFGFGLIIAALVSLIIFGVAIVRADLAALQGTSKENVFWSAAQVEREFNALQVALARHALDPKDEGANVQRRFDILWSRLELFQAGDVGQRLVARASVRSTVDGLKTTLREIDPAVQALGNDGPLAKELGDKLAESAAAVRRATVDVLHTDEARYANIREDMRSGLLMTAAAVLFCLLLAIGTVLVFYRQAKRNAALAKEAKEAGESKARFFSMMSHELRTPLNGLLGALNLLRDLPVGVNRARLLDEAGGSAHRLSDVLTDALALGADDSSQTVHTVFSSLEIATTQSSLLDAEMARRGANLWIEMEEIPVYAEGDLTRLNKATSHLLRSVLQRGGATDLTLQIKIDADAITLAVSSDTETPPEAFGETLARGLLEVNGGTLDRTENGWQLSMPVAIIVPKVLLQISSASMAGLYERLLVTQGITVTGSRDDDFQIILTDPILDEAERRSLRENFPNSRIIACGSTELEVGFDAVLSSPDDLGTTVTSVLSNPPLAA